MSSMVRYSVDGVDHAAGPAVLVPAECPSGMAWCREHDVYVSRLREVRHYCRGAQEEVVVEPGLQGRENMLPGRPFEVTPFLFGSYRPMVELVVPAEADEFDGRLTPAEAREVARLLVAAADALESVPRS